MDFRQFRLEAPMSRLSGVIVSSALLAVSLVLFLAWQRDPLVAEEDHLMEWMQASFLGLAASLHLRRSRRMRGETAAIAVFFGLALLSSSFMARELDIDSWGNPAVAEPTQFALRAVLIILWLVFARFLFKHFPPLWKAFPGTLGKPVVVIAFVGCCFYLASWPFEKELFPISTNASKYWGQLTQLFACALLFAASFARLFPLETARKG